ncbi:MAG: LLM class flavin-dependent oxidoreductase, partial [Acidimicrobiia bacterium]
MLEEGVEIMKAMWTEEVVNYDGKHYRLEGAICQPKPVQSPHIPLWVAGGGEQLTLRVA